MNYLKGNYLNTVFVTGQSQSKVKVNFIEQMQHSTLFCFGIESKNTYINKNINTILITDMYNK